MMLYLFSISKNKFMESLIIRSLIVHGQITKFLSQMKIFSIDGTSNWILRLYKAYENRNFKSISLFQYNFFIAAVASDIPR